MSPLLDTKEITRYWILVIFLAGILSGHLVTAQNLSENYGQHCDFHAALKDEAIHIQQCNKGMKPVSESFFYVVLVCNGWRCKCPDIYHVNNVNKTVKLNATGYEWSEDKAQCLLSLHSDCSGIAKKLCASGNCFQGKCSNETIRRDNNNNGGGGGGDGGNDDDNGGGTVHRRGGALILIISSSILFLPVINQMSN